MTRTPFEPRRVFGRARYVSCSRRSVMTSGQTAHASAPLCENQRHCSRIEQRGSATPFCSVLGTILSTASITPQRVPVHCPQALLKHEPANRNRFSGERPLFASSTKVSSMTMSSSARQTVPSPCTRPKRMAPGRHGALGQRIGLPGLVIVRGDVYPF